ncbi:MAG: rod shape-determining protein RodA [Paludibacteraceae bacterium]|nr:rod shape-determining protein RodA [Paludibacteraceae bacterium]
MRRNENILKMLDWWTIGLYLVLIFIGWCTIYAACYDYDNAEIFNFSANHGKQIIWISTAFILGAIILTIDSKFYSNIAYLFYVLMIILLIATIFLATDTKGSHSWLNFGAFKIQPAEFAKYATCLCLSAFLSKSQIDLRRNKDLMLAMGIILLPALIIIAQSETGSALVFFSFFILLFREGMNGMILILGVFAIVFFILVLRYNNLPDAVVGVDVPELLGFILVFAIAVITALIFLKIYTKDKTCMLTFLGINIGIYAVGIILANFVPAVKTWYFAALSIGVSIIFLFIWGMVMHRQTYMLISAFLMFSIALSGSADYAFNKILAPHQQIRIKIVLGLEDDPQGAGYNVRQSQIAIGSGGLTGKGYLNGTQTKLNYVPEQDTDFIFCTIAEEWGFIGSTLFIIIYATLMLRLIFLAERQRSAFSRIYGYGILCIFLFHFFINLGMVTGITPVIGIPLPLISYGGSSLWGFTLLLFTFIRLDANRMEVLQAR